MDAYAAYRVAFEKKYNIPCPPQLNCPHCLKRSVDFDDGYISDSSIKDIVRVYREKQKDKWLKEKMKERPSVGKKR